MTDRELLELAAKAAGLIIVGSIPSMLHDDDWLETTENGPDMFWNPLQNDGDALRLAMKLGASIHVRRVDEYSRIYSEVFICDLYGSEIYAVGRQEHDADPASATRRAIVRAAAEIGRSMK